MAEIKIYKNNVWKNIIGQEFDGNEFKEGDKIYADGKWYEAEKPDTWYMPLTFTAKKAGSTVKLTIGEGSPIVSGLQYRLGTSGNWNTYVIDTVINLTNIDDKVQFQNTNDRLNIAAIPFDFESQTQYVQFVMTGTIAASGNIQSMLNYRDDCPAECLRYLFYYCDSLLTPPELPAKNLGASCYGFLFAHCTSLRTPPELPATIVPRYGYNHMFWGCTNLTEAPELPATALDYGCYSYMFSGCTSLKTAPEKLPATTLARNCYNEMFFDCKALINAPELPAAELVDDCYRQMFWCCRHLKSIKVRFTNWQDGDFAGTINWVPSVASTGTFYKPRALPEEYGDDRIPEGWTVVNID